MLRVRSLSAVGVVLIGVVPALWGAWGVAVAFAVIGVVSLYELRAMFGQIAHAVIFPVAAPVILLAVVAVAADWPAWVFGALAAAALAGPAFVLVARRSLDGTLAAWLATTFVTLYLAVPLAHIVAVRQIGGPTAGAGTWLTHLEQRLGHAGAARGLAWFLLALVTTWLADTFAYLTGRAAGKHRMAPALSPNKTWEGFAGGVVGAIATAIVANWCFGVGMRVVVAALAGAIIAVVAAVGDLAESLLKRQTGVKDSGTLIPGHGGVLDRVDSQLFAFIVVYYIARAAG